jgi:Flp pilus assembly protein TadG
MRYQPRKRPGTVLIEAAFVYPVAIILVLGLIVGGFGVVRYQEVASLAREGARYASTHGNRSAAAGGNPATATDVYNNAILPAVVALDVSQLKYNVTWNPDNNQGSTITVKIDYQWIPEALLGGIKLSSTSVTTVSY